MIEVKHLTKIYSDKNKENFVALNDVSFTLPHKGMVFILGKSGSGKSTLLNMLGGLDKITSGDIIADGNKFSEFNQNDYDNYRNTYLGFVFQDFCLIENLTIYQNIELALQIKKENDKDTIYNILEKVGLKGFEKRYPKELSGGQKQRVAIARALVKNPKLILADEPTGNLDSKTSRQILNIFKKVSKTSLVVLVSHNKEDADTFADRIIEIEDGKIIRNVTRNKNYKNKFSIENNVICLPDRKLTEKELKKVNDKIQQGQVKVTSTADKFIEDPIVKTRPRKLKFENKNMSVKSIFRISYDFLRHRKISLIFTVTFVLLIITLLSVCQMFMTFDEGKVITEALNKREEYAFVMKKGYRANDKDYIRTRKNSSINENEIHSFKSNGYSGNIFKLYNTSLPISKENCYNDDFSYLGIDERYENIYASEGVGVLQCDITYLTNLFGENGKLTILSGDINPSYSTNQLIITDYFADSLLFYNVNNNFVTTGNDIYGNITNNFIFGRYSVCAVIKTDYKEKYASLIEQFEQYSSPEYLNQLKTLIQSEEFVNFIENLDSYYNIAYSLNPQYAYSEISIAGQPNAKNWFNFFGTIKYTDYNQELKITSKENETMMIDLAYEDISLNQGEILMPLKTYNTYFGTNFVEEDDNIPEQTIQISHYNNDFENINAVPAYTKELKVVGVVNDNKWIINSYDFYEMAYDSLYPTALYFDNTSDISKIYNTGFQMDFAVTSSYFNAIMDLTNIVNIFKDYFGVIGGILSVVAILLLVNFGYTSVKANIFEIGVIKALGGKNKNLSFSFILQMLFIGIFICIFTTILSLLLVQASNSIIVDSFVNFYRNDNLKNLVILYFVPNILIIDLCITIFISLVSALFPIFKLKKVKPFNIMKQKI